jgi:hypothetical protein
MSDAYICPCDDDLPAPPTNLPGLSQIDYRTGDFVSFRRALLTPLDGEKALTAWRPGAEGDLGVMMLEWWAYLADTLCFYNERIANQGFLRTADLPESPGLLVALLGYRPRPAIGATGTLAALVTPGQSAVLPKGLQFQSKPSPGQPPQIFELSADTAIGGPDQATAKALAVLLSPRADLILVQGAVRSLAGGQELLLRERNGAWPCLARVASARIVKLAGGGQQTQLSVSLSAPAPAGLAAAQARLDRPNQKAAAWSIFGGAVRADKAAVHLSGLVRQIRPSDWVMVSAPGFTPQLMQVSASVDAIWDAAGSETSPTQPVSGNPIPLPHTVLVFSLPLDGQDWIAQSQNVTVSYDWAEVGQLVDQPPPPIAAFPAVLLADQPTVFPAGQNKPVMVQDAAGQGVEGKFSSPGGEILVFGDLPTPAPTLHSPVQMLFNLLPVTRGQTVSDEVLGSGDATQAGQSFALAKSPVTYLAVGATYASTVTLTVSGQPWKEVASFYGQPPDAQVFVTREDSGGQTHVEFGDGVNGARLPTGVDNVVASYRFGAGAQSPPAGKLTVIASSFPGLRSILNPVAVSGGADPDPPNQIRRYAPRSVLTFGRAVSVLDYQAIAAGAPGVTRAQAVWGWDPVRQRSLVRVYVGDDAGAKASAATALEDAGDPNRPVQVEQAKAVELLIGLAVVVTPGWNVAAIKAGVTAALADPDTGLFAPARLQIGQAVFDSQIEAACLSTPGAVAVRAFIVLGATGVLAGPVRAPGEGAYFDLPPARVFVFTEPDPNG